MKVQTTRFGELDIPEKDIITFSEGILGFFGLFKYFLKQPDAESVFRWLQSVERSELAFVICDPRIFKPDYAIKVRKEDLASIELEDVSAGDVWVIVRLTEKVEDMTANLQGPLIINKEKMLAKQLVLPEGSYELRHHIFPEGPEKA